MMGIVNDKVMKNMARKVYLSITNDDEIIQKAKDMYLATSFLYSDDCGRYSGLMRELENNFTQGINRYPKHSTQTTTY